MKDLTKGNIYKTFILFAIPLVLSGLLTNAFSIVNSVIAGKFLGSDGIAATGATSDLINFLSSVFWGFSTGTSVYTAVLFGSKNYEQLKTSLFSNAIILAVASSFVSLMVILFRNPIFDFLKVDSSIRGEAIKYFVIIFAGQTIIHLNTFLNFTMNAFGLSSYPLRMALISTFLTIIGNILSTAVFRFGVAGIATSTVIAAVIVFVFYIIKLKKCFREMDVGDYPLEFSLRTVGKSVSFSLPTTAQQLIMYTSTLFLSPIINAIGSSATAAYSVSIKIYSISSSMYQNSSKTLTNYVAQSIGAGKYQNIKRGLKVGALQGVVLLLPILIASVVFAEAICKSFFPEGFSGDSLVYSIAYVKYFLPFIILNLINNLYHSFYRGTKSMGLLMLCTAVGSVTRLVASMILAPMYGIYGIYGGWVVSWAVESAFALFTYLSGMWKKPLKKKLAIDGKEISF